MPEINLLNVTIKIGAKQNFKEWDEELKGNCSLILQATLYLKGIIGSDGIIGRRGLRTTSPLISKEFKNQVNFHQQ